MITSAAQRQLTIVVRSQGQAIDAIRDHAEALARAVDSVDGWQARCVDLQHNRPRDLAGPVQLRGCAHQTVLIQYNPFSFGRRGLAPWLPVSVAAFRRAHPSVAVAVLVHEPYLPASSVKWAILHVAQRSQLHAVARLADIRIATTRRWAEMVPGFTSVLPVGSNLPDRRCKRGEARQRLGAGPNTVVVAAFGTDHPGRLPGLVRAGVRGAQQDERANVIVLNLGADAPAIAGARECVTPGRLDAGTLAEHLAAADLFVAPFDDGMSTRRTTVMAALQHGLPVLGIRGVAKGTEFPPSEGVILLEGADPAGFSAAAYRLASDGAERQARGLAARRLYETHFAWDVLGARVTQILAR